MPPSTRAAIRLHIRGRVQGVGFRPFVFRLAQECGIAGLVRNTAEGALIEIEGEAAALGCFRDRLAVDIPPGAVIDGIDEEPFSPTGSQTFAIAASKSFSQPAARVPPDRAICPECRADIFDAENRRRAYPFTNCTNCGPRYSIVEAMPYDRPTTTMRHFRMCEPCVAEYGSPGDRRFHAQPNACPDCGPKLALWDSAGRTVADQHTALAGAVALLRQGQIVAVKGLGGFQLMVRADQADAVQRLRQRKHRPSKPLAVMVPSSAAAEQLALLDPAERQLLESAANPIVLLTKRSGTLPDVVAPRANTVGLFLPTTPLHHLLLSELGLSMVATSGNRGDEPIAIDERAAVDRLAGIADALLVHDRPIHRAVDDSVARIVEDRPMLLRLARGYAPLPLPNLEGFDCPPMLATGGHQKVALAAWTGAQAILTQHIGDMDGPQQRAAFNRGIEDLSRLYGFDAAVLACDLHPDYFSTRWAIEQRRPVRQVQHHHAHAAAAMVEHGLLDREVLALTWDGTGFGTDGTIWGGEVLRARSDSFERVGSLLLFPLPGGEAAIRHPNRAAFGLLHVVFGAESSTKSDLLSSRLGLSRHEVDLMQGMIRRSLNSPWTSSMGRLFDAVAALVLGVREVSYEGEAAAWLEAIADPGTTATYTITLLNGACPSRGDWRPMMRALLQDLDADVDVCVVAAKFHNALADWGAATIAQFPERDVVLCGGCFQNRLLAERTAAAIRRRGREVHVPGLIPPGDGGLAVGQLALARR